MVKFPKSLILALCLTVPSQAAVTFSTSTTAPTIDGADIFNLSLGTAFADFQTSIMWGDRPARGQTFTTGSNVDGYQLSSVTVQSTGGQNANGSYEVRIGTISGTNFTLLGVVHSSGTVTTDVAANDYVTFTFDAPITLAANTLYGFDVARQGSGWQLNNNTGVYSGGQRYTSGGGGTGGATISYDGPADSDRIFHLDVAAIPEPSAAILGGLGALLLLRRRRV